MKALLITAVYFMGEAIGYLILIRIILSMFGVSNRFMAFLYQVTEPILAPIRNLQFRIFRNSMFDFSPIIAWCLIDYIIVPAICRILNYILV